MLDQLIESKSNAPENRTRGGFLLTTFVLVVGLCFSAVLYSLFAKDFGTGIGNFELSRLVAPIADNAPPAPVNKPEMSQPASKIKNALPSRQANILRIEESPIAPKEVSTTPNTQKSRPIGEFVTSDKLETNGSPGSPFGKSNIEGNTGSGINMPSEMETPSENSEKLQVPPPLIKKVEEKIQKPKTSTVTGGVVNGKAKFLPKPIYTAAAKAVKATGDVNVQVMIDEAGTVVSAKAVGGHPLLRMEAEKAARNAKFDPTFLTGQPVKVSGIIVYKFSMQ